MERDGEFIRFEPDESIELGFLDCASIDHIDLFAIRERLNMRRQDLHERFTSDGSREHPERAQVIDDATRYRRAEEYFKQLITLMPEKNFEDLETTDQNNN